MKHWITFLFLLTAGIMGHAQTNDYQAEVLHTKQGMTLPYRYLAPQSMKTNKQYPLVIFLHGIGERGNDNKRQLIHCGQAFLNPYYRDQYPAHVLFPQCPAEEYWSNPTMIEALKELIDTYLQQQTVDRWRVYIIGISMGAIGTYELVSHHPELFAAAIPICGHAKPELLKNARKIKFRIFHGDADPIVPVQGSRDAYRALKEAGADVEYIEFAGCKHESWDMAFNYPDFMEWLFNQRKKR